VEPHGPLPVGTDNIIAEYLANSLAERFQAGVLPLFPFGINRSLYGYKGGISISPETFKNVIYEVCYSLKFSGVKEVVIFNGHGGNTQHLREVKNSCQFPFKNIIAVQHDSRTFECKKEE
jgi:creatinine amidohydrolase